MRTWHMRNPLRGYSFFIGNSGARMDINEQVERAAEIRAQIDLCLRLQALQAGIDKQSEEAWDRLSALMFPQAYRAGE